MVCLGWQQKRVSGEYEMLQGARITSGSREAMHLP